MKKSCSLKAALTTLVVALAPTFCVADTAVFQEGISDANGTNAAYNMEVGYMIEGFGGVLRAQDAGHQIGGFNASWGRAVIRWDISSLAGKGTITDARAKITFQPVVRAEGTGVVPNPLSYRLYRLTDANRFWVDAEVHRDRQAAGPIAWAGSVGAGTPGVDYLTPAVAEVLIAGGANDVSKQVLTFDFNNVSFLQDWVDNPANNAGFLLISEELEAANDAAGAFAQGTMFPDDVTNANAPGERYAGAVAADRPILEVDFTLIPEPSTALMLLLGSTLMLWRRQRR